ncbi:MAG: DUF192 domain-containing protein [Verrucomicrobia bacterium]|nr:DUF192 domain-containing protein [Verrucomicrobiota bacterium]
MRLELTILFLLAALASLAGCQKTEPAATVPPPPMEVNEPLHLNRAQTGLPVMKLWVGAEELTAEVCLTAQQMATGMMFRTNLAENAAMLFPFATPQRASFYMRNTTVPLSAAYLDAEGAILEIRQLKPLDETPAEAATDQVQYVLEVNQGWFARHNVTTGAVVRTPSGSLRQHFFRQR